MIRSISAFLFFVVSHGFLFAEGVKGIVMDSDSIPIEFANITAFVCDSVVGGGVTDSNGEFRIEVGSDCNRIRVSFIGYDDKIIFPLKSDLGRIVLEKTSTTLQEVVVVESLFKLDLRLNISETYRCRFV